MGELLVKVLITGSTGFLGSNLTHQLIKEKFEVIALIRRRSDTSRIADIMNNIRIYYVEDNISDIFIDNVIDLVIHTATNYGKSNENVSDIITPNLILPIKLLELSVQSNVKLFINTDTALPKTVNFYSLSKKQFMEWGKFFGDEKKISFINLVLEYFYGTKEPENTFVSFIINSCIANKPEIELTQGNQKRNFIFIDDLIDVFIFLIKNEIECDSRSFKQYELGSDHTISIKDFVEMVHRLTKSDSKLLFGAIPYRTNEMMNSETDINKIYKLGYSKEFKSIEDGLKRVLDYKMKQFGD